MRNTERNSITKKKGEEKPARIDTLKRCDKRKKKKKRQKDDSSEKKKKRRRIA